MYELVKNFRWQGVTYAKGDKVDKIPEGASKYKHVFKEIKKKKNAN